MTNRPRRCAPRFAAAVPISSEPVVDSCLPAIHGLNSMTLNLRITGTKSASNDTSKAACVPQILHHYSVTPGSLSHTRTMRRFDWVSALRRVRTYMGRAGVSTDTTRVMDEFYLPRVAAAMVREVSSAYLPYRDAVRLCKNSSIRRMVEPVIRTDLKDVRQLRVQRLKSIGIVYLPGLFVLAARAYGFRRQ